MFFHKRPNIALKQNIPRRLHKKSKFHPEISDPILESFQQVVISEIIIKWDVVRRGNKYKNKLNRGEREAH